MTAGSGGSNKTDMEENWQHFDSREHYKIGYSTHFLHFFVMCRAVLNLNSIEDTEDICLKKPINGEYSPADVYIYALCLVFRHSKPFCDKFSSLCAENNFPGGGTFFWCPNQGCREGLGGRWSNFGLFWLFRAFFSGQLWPLLALLVVAMRPKGGG